MNEITVSAKTVHDAITEASIQLGTASTDIEFEVITEGKAGFLGFGAKQAVIKAWKKVEKIEKVEEKVKTAKKEIQKKEAPKKETLKKETPKKENSKKEAPKKAKKEQKKEVPSPVEQLKEKDVQETKKEEKIVEVTDATKAACEKFVLDVLQTMGMEVEIFSSIDEDGVLCINMEGENMGLLIGKRGQTLDSLQYLTNRIANKMQDGYVRVKLDTENYRQRRKETLENLAKNIAHKVKRTKRPVSLEPMNPYERRIIHSALQGDRYVSTHSEGEEPYRRVVVTLNRK